MLDFNGAARPARAGFTPKGPTYFDAASSFRQAMLDAGLRPDEVVDTSGSEAPIRCPVEGDKPGRQSGWYVFYSDGIAAGAFGNWKTDEEWTWSAKNHSEMSEEERAAYGQKMARAKVERDRRREELASAAAKRANENWERATACSFHPYLEAKGIASHGLKLLAGKLLVPVTSVDGALRSIQEISADGEKHFYFGGKKKGGFYCIPGKDKVALCEGFATAASVHEATGWTALVAFDAGNILPVAEAWRSTHPSDVLVVCGDDDRWKDKNTGRNAAEACAKAMNTVALFPSFASIQGNPTDWNDLHSAEGAEEVRRQLLSGERGNRHFLFRINAEGPYATATYTRQKPPDLQWAFLEMALMGSPFVLSGAGGTGKTSVILSMAASLAIGRALLGPAFTPGRKGRSMVLLCEDPVTPIWQRTHKIGQLLSPDELDEFDRNVNIISCVGEDMRLVRSDPVRGLVTTEAFEALRDAARKIPDLVAIFADPLNLLHGADVERNEEAAQFFCSKLAQLGLETGAAIIVAHHSVKNGTGKGSKWELEEALHVDNVRGSGAIVNGMRGACSFTVLPRNVAKKLLNLPVLPAAGEYVAGKVSKINYAAQGDVFYFRRGDGGILYPVQPAAKKPEKSPFVALIPRICAKVAELHESKSDVTQRVFVRTYDKEWGVQRSLLDDAIEKALNDGLLDLWEFVNASNRKTTYLITGEKWTGLEDHSMTDFNDG